MPTKRNRAGNQQPYVPEGNGDASGEYADGEGINGSGVYTATNKQKAIDYAKDNGGIIEILLSPNAKIADGVQLYKDAKELQFSLENGTDISGNPIDMGLDSDKLLKIGATNNKRFITLLALANGYDAIEVGNGDYIILNRTATIVKGDE